MDISRSEQVRKNVITEGRAYVRRMHVFVNRKQANALLERNPAWTERLVLWLVRFVGVHRLRGLVMALPADVTTETRSMVASDR